MTSRTTSHQDAIAIDSRIPHETFHRIEGYVVSCGQGIVKSGAAGAGFATATRSFYVTLGSLNHTDRSLKITRLAEVDKYQNPYDHGSVIFEMDTGVRHVAHDLDTAVELLALHMVALDPHMDDVLHQIDLNNMADETALETKDLTRLSYILRGTEPVEEEPKQITNVQANRPSVYLFFKNLGWHR